MKSITKTANWYIYQEKANQLLGFSSTKGSGNQHGNGDGLSADFMHECKYRESNSLTIPKSDWQKFLKECSNHRKKPIFTIIRPTENDVEILSCIRTQDLHDIIFSTKVDKFKFINTSIDFMHENLSKLGIDNNRIEAFISLYEKKVNTIGL